MWGGEGSLLATEGVCVGWCGRPGIVDGGDVKACDGFSDVQWVDMHMEDSSGCD